MNIIFLHPPSIYDFRKSGVFFGPTADAVPSSQVFEMYPLGIVSLANYLERNGHKTRIANLALKMLNRESFDCEEFIKNLKPKPDVFAIDLHWLIHVQGSLEIARICKKIRPCVPVIFGGLSATYFSEEILKKFPAVDYVIKGDTTEPLMLELINNLEAGKSVDNIRNLTFRKNNKIKSNPITYIPDNYDDFTVDMKFLIKSIIKNKDFESYIPYKDWVRRPIMALLTSKGCTYNCANCGGSKFAYERICGREKPAFLSPQKIIDLINEADFYMGCPVFFLNDIRMGGKKYYSEIFDLIKKERIDTELIFELFAPAGNEFIGAMADSCKNFNLQFSPEDANPDVRASHGKHYTNEDIEKTIACAAEKGCKRFDIFFMIGLGMQKREDVLDTLEYIDKLMGKFNKILYPFVSPYAATLDPGSLAFENPEEYGYTVFYKSLEEHYDSFNKPSWKYFFNYQTKYLTLDDITDLTYISSEKLSEIKFKHGLISEEEMEQIKSYAKYSREVTGSIEIENNEINNKISGLEKPLLATNEEMSWQCPKLKTKIISLLLRGGMKIFH